MTSQALLGILVVRLSATEDSAELLAVRAVETVQPGSALVHVAGAIGGPQH